MSLAELSLGQKAKVVKINSNDKKFRIRMTDIGFVPGSTVCIKRVSPFKDPIIISIHDYKLSLGKSEASKIEVTI